MNDDCLVYQMLYEFINLDSDYITLNLGVTFDKENKYFVYFVYWGRLPQKVYTADLNEILLIPAKEYTKSQNNEGLLFYDNLHEAKCYTASFMNANEKTNHIGWMTDSLHNSFIIEIKRIINPETMDYKYVIIADYEQTGLIGDTVHECKNMIYTWADEESLVFTEN